MELDVHLTRDDEVVVFHDDDLKRICGAEGRIEDMTLAELRQYRLCGTQYGIPTLKEVLAAIDGRCPMIVELKKSSRRRELCRRTYEFLREYNGRWCIESFDPRIVLWFRVRAGGAARPALHQDVRAAPFYQPRAGLHPEPPAAELSGPAAVHRL